MEKWATYTIAHTDKNMQKQQHRKYQTRETNLSCNYKQKELHIVRSCPFPPPFTYSNKESFQQAERSGQESCAGPLSGPLLLWWKIQKYQGEIKLQRNVTDFIHNVWQKTSNAALHSNQAYYTLNKRIFQENKGWFSNVLSCTIQRHLFMPRFL